MTAETRKGGSNKALAGLLAVFALLALTVSHRAQAQTQPAPPPAVLTAVAVAEAGPAETHVILTFGPSAPKYSIVSNDSDKPSIAFALSTRGASVALPSALHGLLQTIAFEQDDTVLILKFAARSQTRITATPVGDKAISIDLTAAPKPGADADVVAGALPREALRDRGQDGFEVVPLKYADVSEVVGLLTEGLTVKSNDAFVPEEPAFGSAGMTGATAYNPVAPPSPDSLNSPFAQSVDDTIAVDRRLNAVILKGSLDRIARLKQKIAQIDVPVQSVLLETVFVELDQSGAKNVGLDFANANSQIAVASFQSGGYIPAGEPTGVALKGASLQAAIYAQVQAGHGRIVSKPRIAAQSGSTAKIVTGDALPILTSIALSGVNAVSQQVQYVNVGVTLQIAPRVSDDGFVTSHVFCVVSSVTGTSQGYPTISQREAETSATVRDGETFVIGGLTEESDIRSDTRIPVLGSAPGIGQLFRLNTGTRSKTELYIVVTPHVVRRTDAGLVQFGAPPETK